MTKVSILPEPSKKGDMMYRAIAKGHQSVAKTAGAALDALTAQLPADDTVTMIVIQNQRADRFFTAQQQQRLAGLMEHWRAARDTGKGLSPAEQAELEALVDAELAASGERAASLQYLSRRDN
ncbi:MAG TPA: hypothetical protein VG754_07330 [Verrucomicrobiae bacterium]|jgi:hypothetical protein|nr:hypothetical protein [Verrucomicrobiae bacterium]